MEFRPQRSCFSLLCGPVERLTISVLTKGIAQLERIAVGNGEMGYGQFGLPGLIWREIHLRQEKSGGIPANVLPYGAKIDPAPVLLFSFLAV
jgi:hypothetical protein